MPDTYIRNGQEFHRRRTVRESVMQRSEGFCEYCGEKGFITTIGAAYLESHHVTPLSEGGADDEYNVVALCPMHHRQAHYRIDRWQLRKELQAKLAKFWLK